MADYKSRYQNSRGPTKPKVTIVWVVAAKMSCSGLLDRFQKRISVDGWKRSETIQKR